MNTKNQLTFYLILALSAIFILTAFYFEGRATERFGKSYDTHLKSFKDAVENAVPTQLGNDWFADRKEDQIGIENELIRRVAGADGALARHYYGSSTEHYDIHVNITCGYSRNVGAHTPDVCFKGSGAVQETAVETFSVNYKVSVPNPDNPSEPKQEERTATFKTAIFTSDMSSQASQYKQRVFWGWKGVGTGWIAPRFPRLHWNSNEPICKMYISLTEGSGYAKKRKDTLKDAEEFMQKFLPELDQILTGTYVLPEEMKAISEESGEKTSEGAVAPNADQPAQGNKEKEEETGFSLPEPPEFTLEPEEKAEEKAAPAPEEEAKPEEEPEGDLFSF